MSNPTFKIPANPTEEVKVSNLIPKACFTTKSQNETTHRFYLAEDGSVTAGVWECDPCRLDIENYPVNEQMSIISGKLILTNADGVEESFGPGEAVFVAKGSKLTWHITERLRKYFMTSA